MVKRGSVLITGASIAGPTLAYWLHRHGFEPTLVDRAEAQRTGGQNIDIRGAGRAVAARMGLEKRILERNTGEVGTRFVDGSGRTLAAFPAGPGGADGPTAELEILRGELAWLLVQAAEAGSELVYGDHVVALDEASDGVDVTLARAGKLRFDLVVLAEGMRSRTRGLVFGREPCIRELGLYIAYFTDAAVRGTSTVAPAQCPSHRQSEEPHRCRSSARGASPGRHSPLQNTGSRAVQSTREYAAAARIRRGVVAAAREALASSTGAWVAHEPLPRPARASALA